MRTDKKVIFVGGTAYSGSTFFHMTLANDPAGFACGEIRWLFYPARSDHIQQMNDSVGETREIWKAIRANGVQKVYQTIFDMYPDVHFIVDSSKNPHWIRSQTAYLAQQGIETQNVLIWKTPLEFANSTNKRNRLNGWDQEWMTYHKRYLSLIPSWRGVQYKAYTTDNLVLKDVCKYVKIPYFEGKHEYWNKTHHSFGGNYSARFHLHQEKVAQTEFLDKTFDNERMDVYRKIYYSDISNEALQTMVTNAKEKFPQMESVVSVLKKQDVAMLHEDNVVTDALTYSNLEIKMHWLNYWMKALPGRFSLNRKIEI